MKQLVQNVASGTASVVEVPAPRPGRSEVLVRVGASLISAGTERMVVDFAKKNLLQKALARPDLVRQFVEKAGRDGILPAIAAVQNRLDSDLALGYSNAGTVIEIGADVSAYQVGDRVACAGGGYASHAEIVRVPINLVAKIPAPSAGGPEIDFEEAAFTTVGAIALQGFRLAGPQLGETVAVIGLGLVGLLTVQLACAAGCRVLGMDLSEERCEWARKMGCVAAGASKDSMLAQVLADTDGAGADVVIICASTSSNEPLVVAGEIARERARVVAVGAVGLEIPRKIYYQKELSVTISRSYGPGRYDPQYEEKGHDYPIGYVRWTENRNMQAFLQLLADRRLNVAPLITHRFPIEDAERGYELISGKTGDLFIGVVLTYPNCPILDRRVDFKSSADSPAPAVGRVTVGMLGAGNFATAVLLPAMKSSAATELVGVTTATGLSARTVATRFGFHYCASDENELLSDSAINTIVIATRHDLHAQQVIAGLSAGKNVFCEKPLCITEEELTQVVEAYTDRKSSGLHPKLMVGFNRRFAPLTTRMRDFLGSVAEPLVLQYRVNAGYLPADHWTQDREQGGGRIVGELCHFIDSLTYLAGAAVSTVQVSGLPNKGRYSDDNLIVTLGFEGGSIGTITYVANGDKSFSKERIEVFGGGTVAVLDDFRSLQLIRGGRRQSFRSRLQQDKGHRTEWETFTKSVCQGGPSPVPFEEIVRSTAITFQILKVLSAPKRNEVNE